MLAKIIQKQQEETEKNNIIHLNIFGMNDNNDYKELQEFCLQLQQFCKQESQVKVILSTNSYDCQEKFFERVCYLGHSDSIPLHRKNKSSISLQTPEKKIYIVIDNILTCYTTRELFQILIKKYQNIQNFVFKPSETEEKNNVEDNEEDKNQSKNQNKNNILQRDLTVYIDGEPFLVKTTIVDNEQNIFKYVNSQDKEIMFDIDQLKKQLEIIAKEYTSNSTEQYSTCRLNFQNTILNEKLFEFKTVDQKFTGLQHIFQLIVDYKTNDDLSEDTIDLSQLPTLVDQNFQDTWKVTNPANGIQYYKENQDLIILQALTAGNQGEVYSGYDSKNNSFLVFKVFKDQHEFQHEKNIYEKLFKNKKLCEKFIYLDGYGYDNEYQLLIIPKAECNLLDFMLLRQKQYFEKNTELQNKETHIHLNLLDFIQIMLFQVKFMIEMEQIGYYLQDNKPENMLIQLNQQQTGELIYNLVATDFGGVYDINSDQKNQQYPTFATRFYFDKKLYDQNKVYSKQDIIQNELHTVARTMLVCSFPDKYKEKQNSSESFQFLEQDNSQNFINILHQQFKNEQLTQIFQNILLKNTYKYQSFQEIRKYLQKIRYSIPEYSDTEPFYFEDKEEIIRQWKIQQLGKVYKQKQNYTMADISRMSQKLDYLYQNNLIQEAYELNKHICEIIIEMKEADIETKTYFINQKAHALFQLGKYEESQNCYKESMDLYKQQFGEENNKTLIAYGNLAATFQQTGLYAEAEQIYQKVIKIQEKTNFIGDDNTQVLTFLENYGSLLKSLGKFEESEKYILKAINLNKEKNNGKFTHEVAGTLGTYSNLKIQQQDFDEAQKYAIQGIELIEEKYGKESYQGRTLYCQLAMVYQAKKQYEESAKYYQIGIKLFNLQFGEGCAQTGSLIGNLGKVYCMLGDNQQSIKNFQVAQKILIKYYGESHPLVQEYKKLENQLQNFIDNKDDDDVEDNKNGNNQN